MLSQVRVFLLLVNTLLNELKGEGASSLLLEPLCARLPLLPHAHTCSPWRRWEPLELLRKLVLTSFVLLIPSSQTFIRLVVALMLTIGFLTLYLQLKPFKADDNDLIAIGGQIGLVCVFLGAGYLKLFEEISKTELGPSGAAAITGFQDDTSLVTIMIIFTIAMVILSLVTVLYKLGTMDSLVTVKIKRTGKEPDLQFYNHMEYHAFMSHVSLNSLRERRAWLLISSNTRMFADMEDWPRSSRRHQEAVASASSRNQMFLGCVHCGMHVLSF